MAGIESRNEKRAAVSRFSPAKRPPMMVEPERLAPGTSARTCAKPTASASAGPKSSTSLRRAPTFSATSSSSATTTIIVAITHRFFVNVPSMKSLKSSPKTPTGSEPSTISQPRRARQARPEAAAAPITLRAAAAEQREVVAQEGGRDGPDVAREVDEDGEQRAELDDGDGGRRLLRAQGLFDPRVKPRRAAGEDEVRRRADGDELGQPLHDAEDDGLKDGHD